jgi:hypothetical protein
VRKPTFQSALKIRVGNRTAAIGVSSGRSAERSNMCSALGDWDGCAATYQGDQSDKSPDPVWCVSLPLLSPPPITKSDAYTRLQIASLLLGILVRGRALIQFFLRPSTRNRNKLRRALSLMTRSLLWRPVRSNSLSEMFVNLKSARLQWWYRLYRMSASC